MNYKQTLDYIHCGFFGGTRPGLERVTELLDRLGNPQDRLRFIHVTGTNGKGSFCAMLESVLRKAGYNTGLYTSPYIKRFNERMMVKGRPITNDELAQITSEIRPIADAMEDRPTEFELITAVAMVYFDRHHCDPVVLEVGMGGRLDATNIIKTPVLSVITGISLDHTKILGDTIGKIAAEKAGILKPGVPLLWCGSDGSVEAGFNSAHEADAVIRKRAGELGCPVTAPPRHDLKVESATLEGTVLSTSEFEKIKIPLLGNYQPLNAQNVLCAIPLLREAGFVIDDKAVKAGMKSVRWPARFEIVSREPLIICDGGHNPEGVQAAVQSIEIYFPDGVNILTGVMADKNFPVMSKMIAGVARKVFCLTPNNTRSLPAESYAKVFRALGLESESFDDIDSAVAAAYEAGIAEGVPTVSLGSLYMYGDVVRALEKHKKQRR